MKRRALAFVATLAAAGLAGTASPAAAQVRGQAPRGSTRAALVKALYAPKDADVYVGAQPLRAVKATKRDRKDRCSIATPAHRAAQQVALAALKSQRLSAAAAEESVYASPRVAAGLFRALTKSAACEARRDRTLRLSRHTYRQRRGPVVSELVLTVDDPEGRAVQVVDLAGAYVVTVSRAAEAAAEVDPKPERDLALSLARLGATKGIRAILKRA